MNANDRFVRLKKIQSLYRRGWSVRKVGAEVGLTGARVQQLLGAQARTKSEASAIRWARERIPRKTCPVCWEKCAKPHQRFCSRQCSGKSQRVEWLWKAARWMIATKARPIDAVRKFMPATAKYSHGVYGASAALTVCAKRMGMGSGSSLKPPTGSGG